MNWGMVFVSSEDESYANVAGYVFPIRLYEPADRQMMNIYRHIAVAVAFTPRLAPLLAEAARIAGWSGAKLSLIHIGEQMDQKKLREVLVRTGLPPDLPLLAGQGSPASGIMELADQHHVDLLIAGALEKERALRYFLGSVARTLVREAECSLMLFTEPELERRPFQRIVVITDFSVMSVIALRKALYLASKEGVGTIDVVRIHSTYGEAMALARGADRGEVSDYIGRTEAEERALLADFIDGAGYSQVAIRPVYLEGTSPGAVGATYAQDVGADLLVLPLDRAYLGILERIFPSDMESVLREIPCNLWIVRDRASHALS